MEDGAGPITQAIDEEKFDEIAKEYARSDAITVASQEMEHFLELAPATAETKQSTTTATTAQQATEGTTEGTAATATTATTATVVARASETEKGAKQSRITAEQAKR